jgi:RimJ/RimL family protein N-acetyltransferase
LVDLQPLRLRDAIALDPLLDDGHVTRMLPPRVRRESGEQFVRRALGEQQRGDGFAFVIRPSRSLEVIGQIRLMNWTKEDREAEVGYWIRRAQWGKGYGTDALRMICSFGFESVRLHRIVASVVDGNSRSVRALEHVGFRLEGRRRRAARIARRWIDVLEFGLARENWRPLARRKGGGR